MRIVSYQRLNLYVVSLCFALPLVSSRCELTSSCGVQTLQCDGQVVVDALFEVEYVSEIVLQNSRDLKFGEPQSSNSVIKTDSLLVNQVSFPDRPAKKRLEIAPKAFNVYNTNLKAFLQHVVIRADQLDSLYIKGPGLADSKNFILLSFMHGNALKLRAFFVTYANLARIDKFLLTKLEELRMLSLKGNGFSGTFNASMFGTTVYHHLWFLDMSNNQIDDLDPDLFSRFPKLTHLNLKDNRLTSIRSETLVPIWHKLQEFDVSGNSLVCLAHCWLLRKEFQSHPQLFSYALCSARTQHKVALAHIKQHCIVNDEPPDVYPQ